MGSLASKLDERLCRETCQSHHHVARASRPSGCHHDARAGVVAHAAVAVARAASLSVCSCPGVPIQWNVGAPPAAQFVSLADSQC